ncbi:MAG: 50S ribosomal protein L6 [Chloroflexota bacterium]
MSRIGKLPIQLPGAVEFSVQGDMVTVKGPKGELRQRIPEPITLQRENGTVLVQRPSDEPRERALHGLVRALLANMVTGVSQGFQRELAISGVGYRAAKEGNNLRLAVGYSHPVDITAPQGIAFEVPTPTRIVVTGIDKQAVGETAAKIRAVRPPEPYLGKGIRYENEVVRRKAGKAGKVGK